jgi:hypothetical protein
MLLLASVSVLGGGCAVGVGYSTGYVGDYPPDVYIATTVPYYFNGYPTYYYGGRWYYREGARWRYYQREPEALRRSRMEAMPMRRNFEPSMRGYAGRPPGAWRTRR